MRSNENTPSTRATLELGASSDLKFVIGEILSEGHAESILHESDGSASIYALH